MKNIVFKIKHSSNPLEAIKDSICHILKVAKDGIAPHFIVGLLLRNHDPSQRPVYVSYRRADQLDSEVILAEVERHIQSNEKFLAEGPHTLKLTSIETINGKARLKNRLLDKKVIAKKKSSIVSINNVDNLCLPRALVTDIALLQKKNSSSELKIYKDMKDGRKIQKERARELCIKANIDINGVVGSFR